VPDSERGRLLLEGYCRGDEPLYNAMLLVLTEQSSASAAAQALDLSDETLRYNLKMFRLRVVEKDERFRRKRRRRQKNAEAQREP
jgi:hypothetical protein